MTVENIETLLNDEDRLSQVGQASDPEHNHAALSLEDIIRDHALEEAKSKLAGNEGQDK